MNNFMKDNISLHEISKQSRQLTDEQIRAAWFFLIGWINYTSSYRDLTINDVVEGMDIAIYLQKKPR